MEDELRTLLGMIDVYVRRRLESFDRTETFRGQRHEMASLLSQRMAGITRAHREMREKWRQEREQSEDEGDKRIAATSAETMRQRDALRQAYLERESALRVIVERIGDKNG